VDSATLLAFAGAWGALVVLPGPDTALVAGMGVARGRRPAIGAALGSLSALAIHVTAAGLGVSALLAQSATAFTVLKLVGAAYLVVLGLRLVFHDRSGVDAEVAEAEHDAEAAIAATARRGALGPAYRRGILTGALNPKSAIFFLTFLPQFLDPHSALAPQVLVLGLITLVIAGLWHGVLIAAASRLRRAAAAPRVQALVERATGTVFVVLGARLATITR